MFLFYFLFNFSFRFFDIIFPIFRHYFFQFFFSNCHPFKDKHVGLDSTNYFYKIDWEEEERELKAKMRSHSEGELFSGSNDEQMKSNEEFATAIRAGEETQSVGDVRRNENDVQGEGLCLFGLVMLVFITYVFQIMVYHL